MALNLKALHILVVEDLSPMRDLIVSVLKTQGFDNVSAASDGKMALEMFRRDKHDMIITDWNLQNINGIDMVKYIRTSANSPNKTVPIIMMTGYGSKEKIAYARDSGVNEILIKPFTAKDLSKRIFYLIKSPRDFIIAENFKGPCRRRRKNENSQEDDKRSENSKGKYEIIKASNALLLKIGMGEVNEQAIINSQKLINENKINFVPIATNFLKQLRQALDIAYKTENPGQRMIDELTNPVMQIKANARIFKYDLLGDLAGVMMGFLDNLKMLDPESLAIVEAHHTTLNYLLQNAMHGDGGAIGQSLQIELENACERYNLNRTKLLQQNLKKLNTEQI